LRRTDSLITGSALVALLAVLAFTAAVTQRHGDSRPFPAAPVVDRTAQAVAAAQQQDDPLPAWNDGAAKQQSLEFVRAVTQPGSPAFVPPDQRIATFDNDGTLWVEKPTYIQVYFILERVRALAPQHPEWSTTQPFKAVLDNDLAQLERLDEKDLLEVVMAASAGMTQEQYEAEMRQFFATWRHPRFGVGYSELYYQPMVELLGYLRQQGFKTFIVSGGGMDFVRLVAPTIYGIPPDQVVGSTIEYECQVTDACTTLVRKPSVRLVDDSAGKPVGIQVHIGQRPLFAVGNTNGDIQMLQYTQGRVGASFQLLVRHDDAVREYAYTQNPDSEHALDLAAQKGWLVVSMQRDWRQIFPFEPE
jgi:phosphoglycolate phosphatase-like HAD superfamily hydrolase